MTASDELRVRWKCLWCPGARTPRRKRDEDIGKNCDRPSLNFAHFAPVVLKADLSDKGMSGQSMMGEGPMPMMQGMCQEHQEMMQMMKEMMGMMKGVTQDQTMKDKMDQRMQRMEEMMKRHKEMMGQCLQRKKKE